MTSDETKKLKIGAVYWLQLPDRIAHPHVIVDLNEVDADKIILCAITTNAKKASLPGNVVLLPPEANLEKQSIVEVSKRLVVSRAQLGAYIGELSPERMQQIVAGIAFVEKSFFD